MGKHNNNKDIVTNDITMEEFHVLGCCLKVTKEVGIKHNLLSPLDFVKLGILQEKIDKILEKGENHG